MTPSAVIAAGKVAGHPILRSQSDARLVELVRAGCKPAFEVIVARYRVPLQRFCARSLPARHAEDVVQQAFLSAYLGIIGSDKEIDLRPWLYRIARNAMIDVLRERVVVQLEFEEERCGLQQPEQIAECRQEVRDMVIAVKALPARQRDAIVLRELEGRSCDEIATRLGVTGGAARQLLLRARASLRAGMGAFSPPALLGRILPDAGGSAAARFSELCGSAAVSAAALKIGVAAVAGIASGVAIAPGLGPEPSRPSAGATASEHRAALARPVARAPSPQVTDRTPADEPSSPVDGPSPPDEERPPKGDEQSGSTQPVANPGAPAGADDGAALPSPGQLSPHLAEQGTEGVPTAKRRSGPPGASPSPGFDGVPAADSCGQGGSGSPHPEPGTEGTPAAIAACSPGGSSDASDGETHAVSDSSGTPPFASEQPDAGPEAPPTEATENQAATPPPEPPPS